MLSPWNHKSSYPASSGLKKSQGPMWKPRVFLDLSCQSLPKVCYTQPFHSTLSVPSLSLQSCSCPCNFSVISRSSSFSCDSISSVQFVHTDYLTAFPPVNIPGQRSAGMKILLSATVTSRDHLHHKGMDDGKWQTGNCLSMAPEEAGTERKDALQRDTFS